MDDPAAKPEGQEWHEVWQKNLSQIDDKLVEFYHEASEKTDDLLEAAQAKIKSLLDKTDMDEKAAAGWEKAKTEGKELAANVENRVLHLIAAGKIKLASLGKKDADK